ncbi:PE family protein, partial [Mycobacterium tuberculosis]
AAPAAPADCCTATAATAAMSHREPPTAERAVTPG